MAFIIYIIGKITDKIAKNLLTEAQYLYLKFFIQAFICCNIFSLVLLSSSKVISLRVNNKLKLPGDLTPNKF